MTAWPDIEYMTIPVWTDAETSARRSHYTFKATMVATRNLLRQEASMIDAHHVVVEVVGGTELFYRDRSGIRQDRAHLVKHPGVVVHLVGTKHRDLRYATDAYDRWEANLRAVALGLEALRKVERYGIAQRGEQYAGWAQLPPGTPMGPGGAPPPAMTVERAAAVLAGAGDTFTPTEVLDDADDARSAYRMAAKRYHPDRGGSTETFQQVEEAWRLIAEHHESERG